MASRLMPDRTQLLWVLGWCLCVFASFCLEENPLYGLLLFLTLGATILALLVAGIWRSWELRRTPLSAISTALVAPLALAALPELRRSATWPHFLLNRSEYDRVVRHIASLPPGRRSAAARPRIAVDESGGVLRIAFVTHPGVVDNWAGIIHDPSGEVALARSMGMAPPHIRELFGGDIVACRHLLDDYFRCSFT